MMVGRRRRRAARHHITTFGRSRRNAVAKTKRCSGASMSTRLGRSEVDPDRHAEHLPGGFRLLPANFEAAPRRRLAGRQVQHADAVAELDQFGERAAAGDFEIVGMRPRRRGRRASRGCRLPCLAPAVFGASGQSYAPPPSPLTLSSGITLASDLPAPR